MPAAAGGTHLRRFLTLTPAWLALGLAACAPAGIRSDTTASITLPVVATTFDVSGRLSARHGTDAFSANFRWHHTGERDELEFASPLGQTVAMLSGDAKGVRLQAADGRILTAGDWVALTEKGLGWRLPVDGLVSWIQGAPRTGAPFSGEAGEAGRATLLRQDGWTIVYLAYAPDEKTVQRPSRMMLSYPEVELRLAVDSWQ